MKRSAKQVIEAILANLEMAANAASMRGVCPYDQDAMIEGSAEACAYRECIDLINTEAADILNDKPERVRYLSDGTPVEVVRPFDGDRPAL